MILKNVNNILTNFLEETKFWAVTPMSLKQNDEYLENLKECQDCGCIAKDNPVPDGGQDCPDCGAIEMMDKEDRMTDAKLVAEDIKDKMDDTDPALNGLRDAYDTQNDADNKLLNNLEESEKNNNFK